MVALLATAQVPPHVRDLLDVGLIMAVNLAVRLPLPETNNWVVPLVESAKPSPPVTLQKWKEKPAAELAVIL